MVNLLQISSAFGRAMETVDRIKMCGLVFAPLKDMAATGQLQGRALDAAIAASAEGYAFPTNLDSDPPTGGLAPQSQAALLKEAVLGDWAAAELVAALNAQHARKQA